MSDSDKSFYICWICGRRRHEEQSTLVEHVEDKHGNVPICTDVDECAKQLEEEFKNAQENPFKVNKRLH